MPTPFSYPVIFIPGIMGSALRDQYPVDPETVWSPFKLLVKAYDRVTLHPSDTRYELIEPSRVTADQVFGLVYSELIEELRHNLSPQADQPVPVYPFAYDWRQPLENTETALAAFVSEVIDRTKLLRHYFDAGYGTAKFPAKVHLVGHSMGGLIIAGYLQKHGEGCVAKVVTIASPLRGSLEAVSKTATGVGALGSAPGSSREREAARVTPALYHLLPSFKGAVDAEPGLTSDLYLPDAWQPGIVQTLASFIRMYGLTPKDPDSQAFELLKSMLNAAWKHRTRIEKLTLKNSKSWLAIVGVGEDTRVSMHIGKDAQGKPRFDLADGDVRNDWHKGDATKDIFTGDNTVPYLGARTKFIPTEQVVCVSPDDFGFWEFKDRALEKTGFHSAMPGMNLVQRLVVSHLRDRIYGDVWGRPAPDLDAGTPWDPPIAGLAKK
jgi:pimeloyl-ACP methyl ester carboxylesterase